jgi:iron complex transport system substrate-binding protein
VSRLLTALVLALVVAVTGCGERSEPVDALEQPYPVKVEGAGDRPTVLKAPPERIVALDPGSAELLLALGMEQELVGVPPGVRGAPRSEEVSEPSGQIDVEAVARLEPDLIVATPASDLVDVSLAQRESGAAVYVQPSSSVDDVERAVLELGFLAGEPVRARRLVARLRAAVARVERKLAGVPTATVFVDTGFLTTISGRSLLGDLLDRAHAESVAGETPGGEPFDVRRLVRLDPDVYLTTSDSRVTLRSLRADPQTARLTAIREGRFTVLPGNLVLRPGPRVGKALARVAQAVHPDAFP